MTVLASRSLPVALRTANTYQTPGLVIAQGTLSVVLTLTGIPTADYENPATSFDLFAEHSLDGGNTWLPNAAGRNWIGGRKTITNQTPGGPVTVVNPPPTLHISMSESLWGAQLRARMVLRSSLTF